MRGFVCLIVSLALVGCGDDSSGADASPDTGGRDSGADSGTGPVVGIEFQELSLPDSVGPITAMAFLPGRPGEVLLTEHGGAVRHVRFGDGDITELGSFEVPDLIQDGDCGLLQAIAAPDYPTSNHVYFGHCNGTYDARITRMTFDGTNHDTVEDTAVETITVPTSEAMSGNHTIGSMGFEDDGTMWVVFGDKTAGGGDGQDTSSPRSSISRIIPEADGGYQPAPGNAFSDGGGAPEIYAWGLRYGWRTARDSMGRFWVGDVGNAAAEEVNLVTEVGQNFGWATCEGDCSPAVADLVDPILAWGHDDGGPYFDEDPDTEPTTRRTVWVGDAYVAGSDDPYEGFFDERIVFGDTCLGWVRGAWADGSGAVVRDEFLAHLAHITSWVQGTDGFFYVSTFGSCDSREVFDPPAVLRVVPRRE
ncbi:MAG: PQQ-dependent sugar dehydrogenase [Myxococcota bacterium]